MARHRMRGHLFAGRYHAMVVEADNAHYFSTIIDYIHLNPARSGWRATHLLSGCKWTSLPLWLDAPAKRPKWIHPSAVSYASAARTRKKAAKNILTT